MARELIIFNSVKLGRKGVKVPTTEHKQTKGEGLSNAQFTGGVRGHRTKGRSD